MARTQGDESAQKSHRQDRKDRKESPRPRLRRDGGQVVSSEGLPDRIFPNCTSESSRINLLNMGGSFASFACFAVELHFSGSVELERKFDCPFHFLHAWRWKGAQLPCDEGAFDDGYSFPRLYPLHEWQGRALAELSPR